MKTGVVVAGLLVVVGAIVAWARSPTGAATLPERVAEPRHEPTPTPAARHRGMDEPPPTSETQADPAASDTLAPHETSSCAPRSDSPALLVEVVDSSTGLVIPGVDFTATRSGAEWLIGPDTDPEANGSSYSSFDRARAEVEVVPPAGYGALRPSPWEGSVATRARSARLLVPIFPTRDLAFRAVDEQAHPVAGAHVTYATVRIASYSRQALGISFQSTAADGSGIVRMLDVPRIRFARATVTLLRICDDDGFFELGADVEDVALDGPQPSEPPTVVLTRRPRGGGGGCSGSGGNGCGRPTVTGPTAPILIRVVNSDGSPGVHISVVGGPQASGETNRQGEVRFRAAPVGPLEFVVSAHGFLPTIARAEVGRDEEIIVREAAPRRVRVEVVDAADHPIPCACVTAWCEGIPGPTEEVSVFCSVAQMDGDVELLTPMTGADGAVDLVEPVGRVSYHATLGGAEASVTSSENDVRIVIGDP